MSSQEEKPELPVVCVEETPRSVPQLHIEAKEEVWGYEIYFSVFWCRVSLNSEGLWEIIIGPDNKKMQLAHRHHIEAFKWIVSRIPAPLETKIPVKIHGDVRWIREFANLESVTLHPTSDTGAWALYRVNLHTKDPK